MKKKKVLKSHIRKVIEAGIADAKAGRIVTYNKAATSKVTVDFPITLDFFNDTGKPVHIRTTSFTGRNPYELSYEVAVMWGKEEKSELGISTYKHYVSISFYAETLRYVFRILKQLFKVRSR